MQQLLVIFRVYRTKQCQTVYTNFSPLHYYYYSVHRAGFEERKNILNLTAVQC